MCVSVCVHVCVRVHDHTLYGWDRSSKCYLDSQWNEMMMAVFCVCVYGGGYQAKASPAECR